MSRILPIPEELLRRSIRVIRPRDLKDVYANPSQELDRLASKSVVLRLAHGYYGVPPAEGLGDPAWKPEIEPVAFGIAAADQGPRRVALVGISAARVLGFVPRALASGVVAVPVRRRPLDTVAGQVHFWNRNVGALETQVWRHELGQGRASTVEQALLEIAHLPERGHIDVSTAEEALRGLASAADWSHVLELARSQRLETAYRRARWFADALVPDAPLLGRPRHSVTSRGIRPVEPTEGWPFGVRDDR